LEEKMKKFTLFAIVALLALAMAVPQVMAKSEVTPYGRMWFDTMWQSFDKNTGSANRQAATVIANAYNANFDEDDLIWTDNNYSMVGFNFKSDCITAKVEFNNAMGQRHWYGTYNFGPGTLLVGHTWDIVYFSNIPHHLDAADYGWTHIHGTSLTTGREAQIQLTFPTEVGTIQFAAVTPQLLAPGATNAAFALANGAVRDYEASMPALRAKWATKPLGPVMLMLFGGYNSYEIVYNPVATQELRFDVDSYVYGVTGIVNAGPFQFWLQASKGQNPRNFSADTFLFYDYGATFFTNAAGGSSVYDSDLFSWQVWLVWKATDKIKVEFLYGEDQESLDIPGASMDWDKAGWGIAVPITICPGFEITPQYEYVDYGAQITNGLAAVPDAGSAKKYGMSWKFTF
jgi:hypothetical protein